MLQELSIRNFAIIDDLHIEFSGGLTALSGETGAGKSIIINAVNLLLGHRVTTKHIRTGSDTAELEALFQIVEGSKVSETLKSHGYESTQGLLIRRIISRKHRHSIYINGHMATAGVLSAITENLASISGQHANQGLLKEEQHLLVLDQYGNLLGLRSQVSRFFHELIPLIRTLKDLKTLQDRQTEQTQLLEFQKREIVEAEIAPEEDMALELERKRLKHGAFLYQTVQKILGALYSNPGAIIETLGEIRKDIDRIGEIDPSLSRKAEAITETTIHLEDITQDFRTYLDTVEIDEDRLEAIEDRLFILQKLKRKYGKSLEDIRATLEAINQDLSEIENLSDKISDTESQISQRQERLTVLVTQLSQKRQRAADTLAQKVVEELSTLGMLDTRFEIDLQRIPAESEGSSVLTADGSGITDSGIDRAIFLIAPNVGEALKPLVHIVSGGELSRVVLALKAILAETESVETLIFDEVDAGIGGKIAEVVGEKLSSLSSHYQTICITHLPQIAKFADHHIRLSKQISAGRTVTVMQPLTQEERVKEIARMLGGVTITEATLEHARELLDRPG